VGAPRPAASPFLAHDHCARYGCERSPSRQAKRSISLSAVVVDRLAEVARRPIGKEIAFVQCAAERRRYFLCIQHGAQESNISP
jgi:hypothetical protein